MLKLHKTWAIFPLITINILLFSCLKELTLQDRYEPYMVVGADGSEALVKFQYYEPSARQVWLIGDFNNWSIAKSSPPYPEGPLALGARIIMEKDPKSGLWVTVVPIVPGRYEYAFAIDEGLMIKHDPNNPNRVQKSEGGYHSICHIVIK